MGVPLEVDIPAVGRNLQDHSGVSVMWATSKCDTMHCAESSVWLLIREFVRFLLHGTGLFLGPLIQLSIFAHSPSLDSSSRSSQVPPNMLPDIEIMPVPVNCYNPKFKHSFGPKEGG
jgi:choline dehydrogenase